MPINLRRTLLLASALQVLGPQHDFTLLMQRLLSGSSGDDEHDTALDRLPDGDRVALLDRYQTIVSDLPLNATAA